MIFSTYIYKNEIKTLTKKIQISSLQIKTKQINEIQLDFRNLQKRERNNRLKSIDF